MKISFTLAGKPVIGIKIYAELLIMSKLLDDVRAVLRTRHYSYRTEKTYIDWIVKYIRFHDVTHPKQMGGAAINRGYRDARQGYRFRIGTRFCERRKGL